MTKRKKRRSGPSESSFVSAIYTLLKTIQTPCQTRGLGRKKKKEKKRKKAIEKEKEKGKERKEKENVKKDERMQIIYYYNCSFI